MLDLAAYLERIGLGGRPGLAEVHRAHSTSIPFENLAPHQGQAVSLEDTDLERKLVAERRGGYCFEQNMLLAAALRELGAEVDLHLARVRFRAPPGVTRPRTHLVLRVRAGGESWLADVGFGLGTPLDPLPFTPGEEQQQAGWRFRLHWKDPELVLQSIHEGRWTDLYSFAPEPVPPVDVEVSSWWASTHPRSPFVTGLIVASQSGDGTRLSLSDWDGLSLTEQTPDGALVTPLSREEIPAVLSERFGLPGFAVGPGGRIVSAA